MQERATFWHVPELENLEVLHAKYLTHSFVPHRHTSFVTSVIDQGVGTILYRGTTWFAPAGSIVVLNPDELHTGEVYDMQGWAYRALYPSVELMKHVLDSMTERPLHVYLSPQPILYDPTLVILLQQLHNVLETDSSLLERESLLLRTYSYLFSHYAERPVVIGHMGKEPRAVQVAKEYLEAHFAHNISLSQLAQITGLSPFHLAHAFHQATGLPPHVYLNHIRLRHAKQLLLTGTSIAAVAYETGFVDQSHLTKRFKQMYGVTPGRVCAIARTYKTKHRSCLYPQ